MFEQLLLNNEVQKEMMRLANILDQLRQDDIRDKQLGLIDTFFANAIQSTQKTS